MSIKVIAKNFQISINLNEIEIIQESWFYLERNSLFSLEAKQPYKLLS